MMQAIRRAGRELNRRAVGFVLEFLLAITPRRRDPATPALEQIRARGSVTREDLRQVLESSPFPAATIAAELGVSAGELLDMDPARIPVADFLDAYARAQSR